MEGVPDNPDWRLRGVRVVHGDELDPNTPQTPGMTRMAAITAASAGASKLWAGTADIEPNAKTGANHHGPADGAASSWSGRERDLRGAGSRPDALGGAARVRRGGGPRRLHLRRSVRPA